MSTSSRNSAIIYLGGGNEVLRGGPGDRESMQFLANQGFEVVTMPVWQVSDFVDDLSILSLGSLLKYGLAYRTIISGFSAGGTVAAYTLVHDSQNIFDAGGIIDAELIGAAGTSTGTGDPSLFHTAEFSNSIQIPALLIWGRSDVGSTSAAGAVEWVRNSQSGEARLDLFDYGHGWQGTAAEAQVEQDIISFLSSNQTGQATGISNISILSNSQVGNAQYDSTNQILQFTVTGHGGSGSINVVIPKNVLNGIPVVLLDGTKVQPLVASDTANWYVFDTYSQDNIHRITIGGQNTIPEFRNEFIPVIASVLILAMAIMMRRFQSKTYSP